MPWTDPSAAPFTTGHLMTQAEIATYWTDNMLATLHPFALSGSTVDVANTAVATTLGQVTIPANSLGANGTLHIKYLGDHLYNNSTSNTLRLRLYFGGGGAILDGTFGTGNANINAGRRPWRFEFFLSNLGATGSQIVHMSAGPTGVTGVGSLGDFTSAAGILATGTNSDSGFEFQNSASVDTTSDQVFNLTAQWSAASANNSFRRYLMHAQVAKV